MTDRETHVGILRALDAAKDHFPGLRVGQLLCDIQEADGGADLYYMPDEELLALLIKYTERHRLMAQRPH